MTIKEAAGMALACQDACNLSGVTHYFDKVISLLNEEANRLGKGTDWINTHPICVLFINKMASLSRSEEKFYECFNKVEEMAR